MTVPLHSIVPAAVDGKAAVAKGNHRSSANDEPEPDAAELARLDADAAYVKFKHSPEYHRQRDEDAAEIERRLSRPWELPK